jgi:hypothetical protein
MTSKDLRERLDEVWGDELQTHQLVEDAITALEATEQQAEYRRETVCEWILSADGFEITPHDHAGSATGGYVHMIQAWTYCPYCAKPIRIVGGVS